MEKIRYPKKREDNELLRKLRERVKTRLASIPEDRSFYLKLKVVLLSLIYFGSYFLALSQGQTPWLYITFFVIMGLTLVLLYLNVFHEAAHENIFKNKTLNRLALGIFDLVGANSYIWKRRHVMSHHNYANVDGWDTDVEQSGPIKIFPHVPAKGIQKHQHKYIFFAYPFYLFNWMLLRDFKDGFSKKRTLYKILGPIPTAEKVKLILFKLFYLFYQIAVPVLFFVISFILFFSSDIIICHIYTAENVILFFFNLFYLFYHIAVPVLFFGISFKLAFGAWIIQIFVASIFALFVLLPLHALPENDFPLPDEQGNLPYSWLEHQLAVTNDLDHSNWFIRHVLGNFNFHVAHHIFPQYHYAYYPEITEEIAKFAEENGLKYKSFTLATALKKHYELLKMNARDENFVHFLFEELDS